MIRLGMIGCGGMAQGYLHRISEIGDRIKITALADIDEANLKKAAEAAPGARLATNYRDIFDDVDAVVLALPHHVHHQIASDCLAAGKHTLLEKPMCNTEAECLDLVAKDKSPDPVLMIGYVQRYNPLWAEMGRLIREKVHGEVFHLSIWTEQLTHARNPWFADRKLLGGGQLFSHGCHYIDLMLDWMGKPVEGTHLGTNFGTPWMDREGTSDVAIKFESGAVGYHMGTWGARGSRLKYAVHAHTEEGMLELNNLDGAIYLHRDPSGGDLPALQAQLADGAELESETCAVLFRSDLKVKATNDEVGAFVDCIEQKRVPLTNARIATQSLRVIWRLYQAEDNHTVADLRGLGLDEFSPEQDPILKGEW
jgi:predicted dehydrogenase